VLETAQQYSHTFVAPDEKGIVSAEQIIKSITPDTKLVSLGLANSELGTIQPVREVAVKIKLLRQERLKSGNDMPLYLHTDASQAAGYIDIKVARLGVDMLTLNAGKIYGPKQVGLLWCHNSVALKPVLFGGGQEADLRPGTENVAGTIGFAEAFDILAKERSESIEKIQTFRNSLTKQLTGAFPELVISGNPKHQLANYLHVSWPNLDAERLIFKLETQGVLVATGAACAANKNTRSHVLEAIGLDSKLADGSVRITLGRFTTEQDIKNGAQTIISAAKEELER
jgi:cysteine desulfurase